MSRQTDTAWGAALTALVAGSLILLISLGVKFGFGLFLAPVSAEDGWGRETYAFAMALQNLVWGASQPFAGMLADRWGAVRVTALGAVLYAAGLWLMATAGGEAAFTLGAGVLIGLGLSGATRRESAPKMTARAILSLAVVFLTTAATTMAFLAWRGQAMALALDVWNFCF